MDMGELRRGLGWACGSGGSGTYNSLECRQEGHHLLGPALVSLPLWPVVVVPPGGPTLVQSSGLKVVLWGS